MVVSPCLWIICGLLFFHCHFTLGTTNKNSIDLNWMKIEAETLEVDIFKDAENGIQCLHMAFNMEPAEPAARS